MPNVLQTDPKPLIMHYLQRHLHPTLLVSMFIMLGAAAHAQHMWLPAQGDEGGMAVHFNRDSSGAILTRTRRAIYSSTDNGATWRMVLQAPVGKDFSTAGAYRALAVTSQGTVIAAAGARALRWQPGDEPQFTGPQADIISEITAQPDGAIYMSTHMLDSDAPEYFRSTDDGRTWEALDSGNVPEWSPQTLIVNPDGSLVAGSAGIIRSTDGGKSWKSILRSDGMLLAHRSGHGTLIMVGQFRGTIHRSIDNGVTWDSMPPNPKLKLATGIANYSADRIIIGSFSGLFESTDDGRTWTQLSARPIRGGVMVLPDGRILAGTVDGVWSISSDGKEWTPLHNGFRAVIVNNFALGADRRVYATTDASGLLMSSDGGATWRRTPLVGRVMSVLETESGTILAHVGDSLGTNRCTIRRSTDQGATWSTIDGVGRYATTTCMKEVGAGRIYLGSLGKVYLSTDDGLTWSTFKEEVIQTARSFIADSNGWFLIADGGGLDWSTDAGTTWKRTGPAIPMLQVERAATGTLYCLAEHGEAYSSLDTGRSWQMVDTVGLPWLGYLQAIGLTRDGQLIGAAIPYGLYGYFGDTWRPVHQGMEGDAVTALIETREGAMLAGTADAGIYYRGAWTLGLRPSSATSRAVPHLVPNPASSELRILLPGDLSGHVVVEIGTVLGERVTFLAEGEAAEMPGDLFVDLAGYASGTYLCRIHDARGIATTRLVIVR